MQRTQPPAKQRRLTAVGAISLGSDESGTHEAVSSRRQELPEHEDE